MSAVKRSKAPSNSRAGLGSDESQFAFVRLQGPLRGGERDAAADQDQDEQLDELLVFAHGEQ